LSHSEEREPNSEEQKVEEVEEDSTPVKGETEVAQEPQEVAQESEPKPEESQPSAETQIADHRLARLMKMRSQYVTEETLRSTEEGSKPKPPPPRDDEEFHDDEEYYDEEHDEHYDEEFDDFEDDDYEDEELKSKEAAQSQPAAKPEPDSDPEPEPEDDDHRVAQLRKLRKTFVTEKDLDIKVDPNKKQEVFKEAKVKIVVCPNCQSEETRGQKICAQCGAKLPKLLVEEEKYNPGTLNKAVMKYYDAVRHLRAETWTIEQFTDFLHDRYELSKAQIDGLHEIIEECGSNEWLPEATELILKSTSMLEDSILIMIDKVNEAVASHVDFDPDDYPLRDADGNQIEYPYEDEDGNIIEVPLTIEDRILEIDFQPELEEIKQANGMMLDTLKKIDEFQKQAQDDLEVSM
jgi:hypothetical protein